MFGKKWPLYSEAEIEAVVTVMQSGKVNYWTGNEGHAFEVEYAEYLGVKHTLAVSNGTNALELCLRALGIGPGDEVIVPCRTFMASASCVVQVGAKPIVCDIDLHSQNLSIETIEPHLNAKTKAIIAVHLGGWPCDMEALLSFAERHHLFLIEDCAQAHGAQIKGKPVGSFGHMAAFSFCQDKIMSTLGEGGLVATSHEDAWKKAWAYKDHGKGYDTVYHTPHPPGFRWLHDSFGSNYRMTEAQAAVGRLQLQKLPAWQQERARNAAMFDAALSELKSVSIPKPSPDLTHAYYRYYLFVEPTALQSGWSRDRIIQEINALGIWCQVGSCSEIYLEKAFSEAALVPKTRFKNAKMLGETSLALLVDPLYSEDEIQKAAQQIKQLLSTAQR